MQLFSWLRRRPRQRQATRRLWLEMLEDRTVPSVYTVSNTSNSSADSGSLPWAVAQADSDTSGMATINFASAPGQVFATAQTITLGGTLTLGSVTARVSPIMITGPSAGVTISGDSSFTVFAVLPKTTVTLSGLTITNGITAQGSGGGVENGGALTVSNCTFSNDSADFYGGAIYNNGGTLNVTGSTFVNDTTNFGLGGAINNDQGTATIANSTFTNDSAFQGGALCNRGHMLTVIDCTLTDDTAYAGGAIFDTSGGLMVNNSTLAGNNAFQGGAIDVNFGGRAIVNNSTLTGNQAAQFGGAIDTVATLTLTNSTVVFNSVQNGGTGGGIDVYAGDTKFADDIVDGNTGGDIVGRPSSVSSCNVIGNGGLTNGVNGNLVGVKVSFLNLAPLGFYGGPTQTFALLPGSLAIGSGSASIPGLPASTTDQRGLPRANPSQFDVGAFQSGQVVNTTADSDGFGLLTLRDAVALADVDTTTTALPITFDPTVFATPQTITLTGGTLTLGNSNETVDPITITGPSAGLTISGANNFTAFSVDVNATATLSGLTITGGNGGAQGGGGAIANSGSLLVSSCTLSGNSAGGGGAIFSAGTLTVINSTLADNSAVFGGAIYADEGLLTVTNSTLASNSASLGGGIFDGLSFATLNNTVVANSLSGGDLYSSFATATISGSNDLIGDGSDLSSFQNSLQGNPLLAALGNYGGPTPTMALLPGSPAIDAGNNTLAVDANGIPLKADERGQARSIGTAVDIGAFESHGFTLAATGGSNQLAPPNTTYAKPLTVTVTANNAAEPVDGGLVIFRSPIVGASAGLSVNPAMIIGGSAMATATANGILGAYTVTASASGASTPVSFALANSIAPIAVLIGPSGGVVYQPLTFTFGGSDPSSPNQIGNVNFGSSGLPSPSQAGFFTYFVNWGDGTGVIVVGASSTTEAHAYTTAGTYTVALTVTDPEGLSTHVSQTVVIVATPQLQNGTLAIPGAAGDATITLTPTLPGGATFYSMKVVSTTGTATTDFGTFAVPSGNIEVYGGPGTDSVILNAATNKDAFALGDGAVRPQVTQGTPLDNGTVSAQVAQGTPRATDFTVGLDPVTSLTIKGVGGNDSLTGPNQANDWDLTDANSGTLDSTTSFTGIGNLIGGLLTDVFAFTTSNASVSGAIEGGGGANTLDFSARGTPVTVSITGSNAGTVGNTSFAGFENLTGGAGNSVFKFGDGGSLSGVITGGSGTNTLDYSGYTRNVFVDLPLHEATAVGGTVSNIQSVVGSQGNNLLVGDGHERRLIGGPERNILIAGPQPATLIGNKDQDILIGGTTNYDTSESGLSALLAIEAEWDRTDLGSVADPTGYLARVNHLLQGGGLNRADLLNSSTFHGNGGNNVLTGRPGLDLFYGSKALDQNDWNTAQGEIFIAGQAHQNTEIDATALSLPNLLLDGASFSTLAPASFSLTPGFHTLASANGNSLTFFVAADGTVGYDPSLQGVLSGATTNTLKVNGLLSAAAPTGLST